MRQERHFPQPVTGVKVRQRAQSFDDHYSQATLFWNSLSEIERDHEVGAFAFELSKVADPGIVARMLANLANVNVDFAAAVALHLGVPAPAGAPSGDVGASPALSQAPVVSGPVAGRVVGVLVTDGEDAAGVITLRDALGPAGVALHFIAPHGGAVRGSGRTGVGAEATVFNTDSVV